jgi:peptidoglycan-N-acetylmuramic acid deacetylase
MVIGMKKIIPLLTACIFSIVCPLQLFAVSTTAYNWYVMRAKNHSRPVLESQFSFIKKYDGYYVNDRVANSEKVIYLTFDAGYTNGNVEKILDTLKKHHAPAVFFILENLVKRNPELVKRMCEEGHTVGNHTKSHPDMTKITDKSCFKKQLDDLADIYQELTGKEIAPLYRPPEGRFSEKNLCMAQELGYKTLFWSFAYADWDNQNQPSPEEAKRKILENVHSGEVMLLHPTSATNAQILDEIMTQLESEGWRFGRIEELWN